MTAHHTSTLAAVEAAEIAAWAAARRDAAAEEIDADPLAGVEDDEWPDGAALPWEYEPTPCTRRSRFDAPVSAARIVETQS